MVLASSRVADLGLGLEHISLGLGFCLGSSDLCLGVETSGLGFVFGLATAGLHYKTAD